MAILIVVNDPSDWPLKIRGVQVVSAKSYISDQRFSDLSGVGVKVFNLCRSYKYQSLGYYVSLLAAARGHKPLPSITTIQDLKSYSMLRLAAGDLEPLVQSSLSRVDARRFELSIYFGRNVAKKYDRLALKLFNLFPAPMLRAEFVRARAPRKVAGEGAASERGRSAIKKPASGRGWTLHALSPISANQIPPNHARFVLTAAEQYFQGRRRYAGPNMSRRYDLAILHNPGELMPPSSPHTLERFIAAARRAGMDAELITKDDYGRLAEFDALFIRETTAVNHHTYRFARRAAAEGLVVIDDPESIVRCSNKVFLAEMLARLGVPHPRTFIAHRENIEDIPLYVGFPCVLKQPDSAFSQGVSKCDDPAALEHDVTSMVAHSDLVIAQEYLPSSYDWRVGVLDRKPLFVCKYHMVPGHWQIVGKDKHGRQRYGRVEAFTIAAAPKRIVSAAVRAANAIGDGLYGVDVKQIGRKPYVIEVNDNPNIDAGCEDKILGTALYDRLMNVFYERIRRARARRR